MARVVKKNEDPRWIYKNDRQTTSPSNGKLIKGRRKWIPGHHPSYSNPRKVFVPSHVIHTSPLYPFFFFFSCYFRFFFFLVGWVVEMLWDDSPAQWLIPRQACEMGYPYHWALLSFSTSLSLSGAHLNMNFFVFNSYVIIANKKTWVPPNSW